jgi:hypothetical protein
VSLWSMERFEEFLTERKYHKNVSHKTLVYYNRAFRSWDKHSSGDRKTWIINMQKADRSAISINTYFVTLNKLGNFAHYPREIFTSYAAVTCLEFLSQS